MNIFQIVGLGFICVFLIVILEEQRSKFGIFITIAFGSMIFLAIFSQLSHILQSFQQFAAKISVNSVYMQTMFKVIGIAYLGEFAAEVCRDCGSNAIASKIELAAKVIILTLAMPILLAILENILLLMPR